MVFLGLNLGLSFAYSAAAAIYRLPPEATALSDELPRPVRPFPALEKTFRVYSLYGGYPFSSLNIEFALKPGGGFERLHSTQVNHVLSAIVDQMNENILCDKFLVPGIKKADFAGGEAWLNRTVGPLNEQSLSEMAKRNYISEQQKNDYNQPLPELDVNKTIYLESLSWISAAATLDLFGGKIPWLRVSEVDAPSGLTSLQVKDLSQKGDPRVRLRLRRAILRIVSGHIYDEEYGNYYLEPLPFEVEYSREKIDVPPVPESSYYRFELGRAAQIPSLMGETRQLSALAALIMWHQVLIFEEYAGTKKINPQGVRADVFFHALKETHRIGYEHFGAKPYLQGPKPHDLALNLTLMQLLEKVLPDVGLSTRDLSQFVVQLDTVSYTRQDFDWIRNGQPLTTDHPITVRMAKPVVQAAVQMATQGMESSVERLKRIETAMAGFDDFHKFQFSPKRVVDRFDLDKHGGIKTEFFVSGLDSDRAITDLNYARDLTSAIAGYFGKFDEDARMTFIVGPTMGGDRSLVIQLRNLGGRVMPISTSDPAYFMGPFAVQFTVGAIRKIKPYNPDSKLSIGRWSLIRDALYFPGL